MSFLYNQSCKHIILKHSSFILNSGAVQASYDKIILNAVIYPSIVSMSFKQMLSKLSAHSRKTYIIICQLILAGFICTY